MWIIRNVPIFLYRRTHGLNNCMSGGLTLTTSNRSLNSLNEFRMKDSIDNRPKERTRRLSRILLTVPGALSENSNENEKEERLEFSEIKVTPGTSGTILSLGNDQAIGTQIIYFSPNRRQSRERIG